MPAHKRRDIQKALKNTETSAHHTKRDELSITLHMYKDDNIYMSLEKCMQYRKIASYGKYAKIALLRMIESDMQEISKQAQTEKAGDTDT
jgi:hypothetical protein